MDCRGELNDALKSRRVGGRGSKSDLTVSVCDGRLELAFETGESVRHFCGGHTRCLCHHHLVSDEAGVLGVGVANVPCVVRVGQIQPGMDGRMPVACHGDGRSTSSQAVFRKFSYEGFQTSGNLIEIGRVVFIPWFTQSAGSVPTDPQLEPWC